MPNIHSVLVNHFSHFLKKKGSGGGTEEQQKRSRRLGSLSKIASLNDYSGTHDDRWRVPVPMNGRFYVSDDTSRLAVHEHLDPKDPVDFRRYSRIIDMNLSTSTPFTNSSPISTAYENHLYEATIASRQIVLKKRTADGAPVFEKQLGSTTATNPSYPYFGVQRYGDRIYLLDTTGKIHVISLSGSLLRTVDLSTVLDGVSSLEKPRIERVDDFSIMISVPTEGVRVKRGTVDAKYIWIDRTSIETGTLKITAITPRATQIHYFIGANTERDIYFFDIWFSAKSCIVALSGKRFRKTDDPNLNAIAMFEPHKDKVVPHHEPLADIVSLLNPDDGEFLIGSIINAASVRSYIQSKFGSDRVDPIVVGPPTIMNGEISLFSEIKEPHVIFYIETRCNVDDRVYHWDSGSSWRNLDVFIGYSDGYVKRLVDESTSNALYGPKDFDLPGTTSSTRMFNGNFSYIEGNHLYVFNSVSKKAIKCKIEYEDVLVPETDILKESARPEYDNLTANHGYGNLKLIESTNLPFKIDGVDSDPVISSMYTSGENLYIGVSKQTNMFGNDSRIYPVQIARDTTLYGEGVTHRLPKSLSGQPTPIGRKEAYTNALMSIKNGKLLNFGARTLKGSAATSFDIENIDLTNGSRVSSTIQTVNFAPNNNPRVITSYAAINGIAPYQYSEDELYVSYPQGGGSRYIGVLSPKTQGGTIIRRLDMSPSINGLRWRETDPIRVVHVNERIVCVEIGAEDSTLTTTNSKTASEYAFFERANFKNGGKTLKAKFKSTEAALIGFDVDRDLIILHYGKYQSERKVTHSGEKIIALKMSRIYEGNNLDILSPFRNKNFTAFESLLQEGEWSFDFPFVNYQWEEGQSGPRVRKLYSISSSNTGLPKIFRKLSDDILFSGDMYAYYDTRNENNKILSLSYRVEPIVITKTGGVERLFNKKDIDTIPSLKIMRGGHRPITNNALYNFSRLGFSVVDDGFIYYVDNTGRRIHKFQIEKTGSSGGGGITDSPSTPWNNLSPLASQ